MKNENKNSNKDIKMYELFKSQVHVLAILLIFKIVRFLFETHVMITSEYIPARLVGLIIEILSFPMAFLLLSLSILIGICFIITKKVSLKKKYYTLLKTTGALSLIYGVISLYL